MKYIPIILLLFIFPGSSLAQPAGKNKTDKERVNTAIQASSKANDPDEWMDDELTEAVKFLKKADENLLNQKIYTVANTNKSEVSPEIAELIINQGNESDRLASLSGRVLKYHKLTDICRAVLFNDIKPRIFTYKLRTISISNGILNQLTDEEAVALIAHEVGHLYVANELAGARTDADDRLARINELKCDAVSLITLRELGIVPSVLVSALKKLIAAREKQGLLTTTAQSPAFADREKLAEIFIKELLKN